MCRRVAACEKVADLHWMRGRYPPGTEPGAGYKRGQRILDGCGQMSTYVSSVRTAAAAVNHNLLKSLVTQARDIYLMPARALMSPICMSNPDFYVAVHD